MIMGAMWGLQISLTKIGAGTQSLTAANTYSGATTVKAGTLALDFTGAERRFITLMAPLGGTGPAEMAVMSWSFRAGNGARAAAPSRPAPSPPPTCRA